MWGADEICLVVPTWTGWWVLEDFFARYGAGGLDQFDPGDGKPARKLTHKAGLVFCHHEAPIHRIRDLAENLAYLAKSQALANRMAYQILESFDSLGVDQDDFWQKRLPREISRKDLVVPGAAMTRLRELGIDLKNSVPRSRLHEILNHLSRAQDLKAGVEEGRRTLARAARNDAKAPATFAEFAGLWGNEDKHQAIAWLHLGELWDYLTPVEWTVEGA